MSGPAPAETRQRTNEPARGDWQAAPGIGWQHGDVPPCPVRSKAAQETWRTWFHAWFASYWTADDLPNVRLCIKAWARADAVDAKAADQMAYVRLADSIGVTRKGQQDRRWKRPEPDRDQRRSSTGTSPSRASRATSPAAHLSVVHDADA